MTHDTVDLAQARTLLEKRRLELLRRIDSDADSAISGPDRASEGRDAGDAGDSAEEAQEEDSRLGDASRAGAELREVEAALARIAAGTYGTCVDCDQPIPAARLRSLPTAERCVEDQEEFDKQHLSGAHHPTL